MTKIVSDKTTRVEAAPFEARPFYTGAQDITTVKWHTDADYLVDSSTLILPIRCCTPRHCNIVEMYLNMILQVTSSLTVKVALGYFDTDGVTPVASYSQAYIDAYHRKITGSDSVMSSSGTLLTLDGLNLLPSLPKRGDDIFNEDAFVLILQFSRTRTSSEKIIMFELSGSAMLNLYE